MIHRFMLFGLKMFMFLFFLFSWEQVICLAVKLPKEIPNPHHSNALVMIVFSFKICLIFLLSVEALPVIFMATQQMSFDT